MGRKDRWVGERISGGEIGRKWGLAVEFVEEE